MALCAGNVLYGVRYSPVRYGTLLYCTVMFCYGTVHFTKVI